MLGSSVAKTNNLAVRRDLENRAAAVSHIEEFVLVKGNTVAIPIPSA